MGATLLSFSVPCSTQRKSVAWMGVNIILKVPHSAYFQVFIFHERHILLLRDIGRGIFAQYETL